MSDDGARHAARLPLAALAYFVPTVAGGVPAAYAACTTIAIFAVMAYGADLVLSYLGEVSLGHTIFWAAGGYAASMLAVNAGWNGWADGGRRGRPSPSCWPRCWASRRCARASSSSPW